MSDALGQVISIYILIGMAWLAIGLGGTKSARSRWPDFETLTPFGKFLALAGASILFVLLWLPLVIGAFVQKPKV